MAASNDQTDLICVGAITGVHGVRGVLTIRPFTERAGDITAYGPLHSKDGKKSFAIQIIGSKKGVLLARIDGISDRTAAEALKGLELYVPRTELPETEDDSWYRADLIGLDVRDSTGASLGVIEAVQNFGAGDLLEIRMTASVETVLLPFTRQIVPLVDMAGGFVTIDAPEEIEADESQGD